MLLDHAEINKYNIKYTYVEIKEFKIKYENKSIVKNHNLLNTSIPNCS